MSIQETLNERESQHGSFKTHSEIEQDLMRIVHRCTYEKQLTDVQLVGLHMVIHKLARILNNGHGHTDSWHDIAGYATLIEQDMLEQ